MLVAEPFEKMVLFQAGILEIEPYYVHNKVMKIDFEYRYSF